MKYATQPERAFDEANHYWQHKIEQQRNFNIFVLSIFTRNA